ncbi:HAD family hydrolase [Streptomyces caatingaensis]|uniref:Hydrolase n=1 Tax=Streptomyces caatingaensis TaxID=1678637 RepID=A0A0K9XFN0_9ACTN|nr:HAD family hydrolase [Streptomyces caatingaensis]KNB52214.1 hydrolase [Streptomyces caatingaensis]
MTVKGVLFDFSGTLFHIESPASWLGAALRRCGLALPEPEFRRLAGELADAGALPGGPPPRTVPARLAPAWERRDLGPAEHRAAYGGLARRVPLPSPALYDALYARHMEPAAWAPYPDAVPVLTALRRHGIRIAVVSNIGWDLRPVFRAHGLDDLVDAYVLSYEHRLQKPDPRLFAAACRQLGLAPGPDVLMVGDNPAADGGASALGCDVLLVDGAPAVEERRDGLLPVVERAGATTAGQSP